jgi:hypothetical protein
VKTIQLLVLILAAAVTSTHADDWRRVAFMGGAEVKYITGLAEVLESGKEEVLRAGQRVTPGQTLRIWLGAEVVLLMDSSKGLVRAKGPVLLRLAPALEVPERASIEQLGYEVRAVRGQAKYEHEGRWQMLKTDMTLPEGTKVRPFRNSIVDLYHTASRTAIRVTDHTKQTVLPRLTEESLPMLLAAKTP